MKKIGYTIVAIGILVMTMFMSFPMQTNFAFAEGASEKKVLISTAAEYYSQAGTLYGVQDLELSTATPFNSEAGAFYDGWSIDMLQDSFGQVNGTYSVLDVGDIDVTGKSLYVWMYFSTTLLHDKLQVSLNYDGGSKTFEINSNKLAIALAKSDIDYEMGYSWNLMEFPYESPGEYNFTSISVKTQSANANTESLYADVGLYEIYVADSLSSDISAIVKQKYQDGEIAIPTAHAIDNLFLGDSIQIPAQISSALKYAYDGKIDLVGDPSISPKPSWKVGVRYNGGEAVFYDLGQVVTFDKEGTYILYYNCVLNGREIMSLPMQINIVEFKGLYFNSAFFSKLEVGKTYEFNFSTNPAFNKTGDYTLEFNSEYIDAEIVDGGKVKVYVKKSGSTDIVLKASGTRVANLLEKEYSAKATLHIRKQNVDNFHIFRICSYVFLGLVGVAIVGFVIKSLVNANKYKVK